MLTAAELAVLTFEETWWQHPGSKEAEIRAQFGVSATAYYQRLNRLIDRDDALAARPLLVRRLRRIRSGRRARGA